MLQAAPFQVTTVILLKSVKLRLHQVASGLPSASELLQLPVIDRRTSRVNATGFHIFVNADVEDHAYAVTDV